MVDFHCHISVTASESGGGTTERGAICPRDGTSGCVPASCESVNPTGSRCCPGPSTVEGRSHVGSCCGDQGSPRGCGPEEEEGPRRPGHGLPGHLQRCYDSGVAGDRCGSGQSLPGQRKLPWAVLLYREASEVLSDWSYSGDSALCRRNCTVLSGPDRIPGHVPGVPHLGCHPQCQRGAERGQRAAVRHSLDCHRDHPLLLLHLQPAQPPAIPHQMGQVHLLLRAISYGSDRGVADYLCSSAVCAEDGPVLRHSSQQVQLLLRLPHLPHPRHDLLHSPLPPALLPHDTTEEEGPGPHRRLQQSGVS